MTSPTPPLAVPAESRPGVGSGAGDEEARALAALARAGDAWTQEPPADAATRAKVHARVRPSRWKRPGPERKESPFWRFGFPLLLVLLAASIPALVLTGLNLLLQSNEGKFEVSNRDSTQPGYNALTPPTPTLLLVQVDDAGKLSGLTVLSQTGETVGGVILIPPATVPGVGKAPLDKVFAESGQTALTASVQELVGAGMGDVQVIDASQWTSLLTAVGALQFNNPEVVDVAGVGMFPKGEITLEPGDAGAYLAAPAANGDDLNRLRRNEVFWRALLGKLGSSPVTLPGDAEKGLTRFLPGLASAQVGVETIPVQPVPTPDRKAALYLPDVEGVAALSSKVIPFPIEVTPGARASTRILDGTGRLANGVGAAPALVKAGGQITGIGNAATFDYKTTQIIFYEDAKKDAADKMRLALGVGELAKSSDPTHEVDVVVILGADYAATPASNDTVLTTPPSVVGTVPVTSAGGRRG
ncbi:MAG: LytR C-terminal domain-containing protein [Actinobacteria bacterium]|nr:LytR C-terminal domain-containing protein [Actinomycetota bacterium]